jgi:hypothetical protein
MTLNFFSKHTETDGKRYDAVNCVRTWLAGKNHLPKDLQRSLMYLIPELSRDELKADNDDFPPF